METTQEKATEQQEAINRCKEWFKEGATVYTICDHVSASGMTRHIRLVQLSSDDDGKVFPLHPTYMVGKALGWRVTQSKLGHDCIVVGGCGIDMGYHLVHTLGRTLYGDGYKLQHEWM